MEKVENYLEILLSWKCKYSNTRNELAAIMKKRNSAGWTLISTSRAIVDTQNQSSNLYLF